VHHTQGLTPHSSIVVHLPNQTGTFERLLVFLHTSIFRYRLFCVIVLSPWRIFGLVFPWSWRSTFGRSSNSLGSRGCSRRRSCPYSWLIVLGFRSLFHVVLPFSLTND
jgi:hypothetical protein